MKPDKRFLGLPKNFWANVRLVSQHVGYTERGSSRIRIPTPDKITSTLLDLGLTEGHLFNRGKPTRLGAVLIDYFKYRADVLNNEIEPLLMDVKDAQELFEKLRRKLKTDCPLPLNKQKGKKKTHAFFTGMINMLIAANAKGKDCNFDPRELTTITRKGEPIRTLARRIDGAFPGTVNPIAIWEIKEYYYTTTFGSRVADGVYESLLDGMELEELREHEGVNVRHYLFVDSHYTWWRCGRAYLCRIIDMLHMGYVDEVIFGREAVTRVPQLVSEWISEFKRRNGKKLSAII